MDGLRALAVLVVFGFHAGFQFLPGGFLGVDVFFVISGYLIGAILLKESERGRLSISAFLERRLRRVLPALFLICLLCLPAAWILLPPSDFKNYAESVFANALSVANYLFLSESGYFDQAAEMKPLLHTWSLSVEIQFYLTMCVALWLGRRFKIRSALPAVLIAGVSSFILYCFLFYRFPEASFYIFPTRLWEFMAGTLTALIVVRGQRQVTGAADFGLLLIVVSVLGFNTLLGSQILATLMVVVGTALVIAFPVGRSLAVKVLSLRPLVALGVVSYSLYLLHNPMLVFARFAGLQNNAWYLLGTALVLPGLSYLSWKYLENPFRKPAIVSARQFGRACAVCFTAALLFFISSDLSEGFMRERLSDRELTMMKTAVQDQRGPHCQTGGDEYRQPSNRCVLFGDDPHWAIFGDSHAGALAYALAKQIQTHSGQATQWLSMRGCPPGFTKQPQSSCEKWTAESIEALNNDPKIQTVIVIFRLNVYFYGDEVKHYPGLGNEVSDSEREKIWHRFSELLKALEKGGKNLVVFQPVPEPRRRVTDLIFKEGEQRSNIVAVPRTWWDRRNKFTLEKFRGLDASVRIFDPETHLCDGENCYAVRDLISYYYDHNHLSQAGADLVAKDFSGFYWGN